jgi:hypothetical protein
MNPRFLFLAAILGLQTAWILGTSVVQERKLSSDTCILLETRPVDPRDLIRGDYVILNYKISDLPGTLFRPPLTNGLPAGETVYVLVRRQGPFHEAVAASTAPLTPNRGEIPLVGTVQSAWGGFTASHSVHLAYGLERFYVREGTGNPRGKLTVEVAVPSSGQATIKQVYLDGAPYAQAMQDQRQ